MYSDFAEQLKTMSTSIQLTNYVNEKNCKIVACSFPLCKNKINVYVSQIQNVALQVSFSFNTCQKGMYDCQAHRLVFCTLQLKGK